MDETTKFLPHTCAIYVYVMLFILEEIKRLSTNPWMKGKMINTCFKDHIQTMINQHVYEKKNIIFFKNEFGGTNVAIVNVR
jgi:hypothetical protein